MGDSSNNIRKKAKHQEFKNNHYIMSCVEDHKEKGLVSSLQEVGNLNVKKINMHQKTLLLNIPSKYRVWGWEG